MSFVNSVYFDGDTIWFEFDREDRWTIQYFMAGYEGSSTSSIQNWHEYGLNFSSWGRNGLSGYFRARGEVMGVWSDWYHKTNWIDNSPQNNLYPLYYPPETTQFVYYNGEYQGEAGSCVANALSSAKSILEYHSRGRSGSKPSIGWIYGNGAQPNNNGMYLSDGLNIMKNIGSPQYGHIPDNTDLFGIHHYPDARFSNDAISFVNRNQSTRVITDATQHKLNTTGQSYSLNAITAIKASIAQNGVVILNLAIHPAFDSCDKYVSLGYSGPIRTYHTLPILGWESVNGITWWLFQNSWGTWWGDNGRGYIACTDPAIESYALVSDNVASYNSSYIPNPTFVKADQVKSTSMRLRYSPIYRADVYNIQVDGVDNTGLTEPVITLTNLSADTNYGHRCRTWDGVNVSAWSPTTYTSTLDITRPDNWQWTQVELLAFAQTTGYSVSDVSYLRWNAFLDRVEEFRDYHNSIHHEGVPSVLQYKMTASDRVMTATRFNGVRFAIGSMNATGLTDVYPGDPVNGFYFPLLSNRLNSIE